MHKVALHTSVKQHVVPSQANLLREAASGIRLHP